ncbi:PAS-domain containing protein [Limibaculum sp. M0105]|uniref:histidine kinase n=1 Tax=Thermohalobaculum xanthum TaxID=2753746 RepID=A0A8J7SHZ3_9RHOB|nr:PAS domain-containing sensor histidine kinase [Thermohalobaculum xanthum]MBK0401067.1 PAS-domain containing protein [Thermohalobaculum xanthum]
MDQHVEGRNLVTLGEVFDDLSDGIMLFDADLRVVAFNRAYARLFELDADEIKAGDTLENVLRTLTGRGMLDTGSRGVDAEVARRLAGWRTPENRVETRRLRNGRLIRITRRDLPDGGMISIHVELTEADERERELERQRALMASILANITDGVALVDASCRFIAFNDRFLDLMGVPRGAVHWGVHFSELARHFADLDGLSEAGRKTEIDRRYRFLSDPSRSRVVRNMFDGRTVDVNKAMLPGGGASVLTLRDVTTDLRRRREVEDARREAEEASRRKSSFVARLSHEMRNALNGILGVSALLERAELGEREQAQVGLISTSGRMLLRLIDDALDVSRITAETSDIKVEPFSLPELLDECIAMVEQPAREKGLELRREGAAVPLPALLGDAVRLKQIVLNLLTNAIKFTERGTVTLGLATELGPNAAYLSLWVADTGIGIPADQREAIFGEFYQIRDGAAGRVGGVGLGLAISARLIQAMGGAIRVESEAPHGSRFTIALRLPFADEDNGDTPQS